jgi:hypothetical protein
MAERKSPVSLWDALPPNAFDRATEKRQNLWHALHEFVRERGGAVVSVRLTSPVRIQISPEKTAALMSELEQLGHAPARSEQVSVFDGKQFTQHDIVIVDLPGLLDFVSPAQLAEARKAMMVVK